MAENISSEFPFVLHSMDVLNSSMAYVDTGDIADSAIIFLFLHGNPTSSYLWRNIIPHVSHLARCIAPDLIGMGRSGKPRDISYRFSDHAAYLEAFLATLLSSEQQQLVLVLHDWGSALGLDWARRHEKQVLGLVLMEFITPIASWEVFPPAATDTFLSFRAPDTGRKLIIEENSFIEQFLPSCVVRNLSIAEMEYYRQPFLDPGDRVPVFRWPNELPVAGMPQDVAEVVDQYYAWLLEFGLPKLLFSATPGGLISEDRALHHFKTFKNAHLVHIGPGIHYVQEDNPHLIGTEIARWFIRYFRSEQAESSG